MSGLRTFWSELNPKISSIYHNYVDNWWTKVALSSATVLLIIIIFNIIPSWLQFGFLLIFTVGMWSFFTSKKPTYQPTKRQFTVTTNYNDVNPNSNYSHNSSINHTRHGYGSAHRRPSVLSPSSSFVITGPGLRTNDEELDQSSSSSISDWHQNTSRRDPIDPITLSAVTSPGFSARLVQKKDSNPLRESNSDLSYSPNSRGSYQNQKSPNSFKLGQLPSPSFKPQPKINPPAFHSPVNTGRFSLTRKNKKQIPFGTTYVHVAPVDVINKSLAASKAANNPNSPNNARGGISFGMGGYSSSPTANITTRMQKLWSPPTMDAVNPYESPARSNVVGSPPPHNINACSIDPGLNRKRNRLAESMVDKRSSTIHHGPSGYGQDDLAKQSSKRTKYIQSSNELRYAGVNASNRNLPFMALPNLQTHDDESMTSESILEQMNQTEKRFLPDDDTISPIRSPKKTRSSAGGSKGSSVGQNSSSPYRKRRVADQSISNLQEEEESEKNRGFCSCSECYEEAAGMDLKGNKIAKQSSPVNSVPFSKKKKTVTFNQRKSNSANQSKGYISAKTNTTEQTDITDKFTPVKMQIISKANYEADQQRRVQRLNRMLNESFKMSEYKPKSPEPKIQQVVANGTVPATLPSFGVSKESSGPQITFGSGSMGSSIFSSPSTVPLGRAGEDQVEGIKQSSSSLASIVAGSETPKVTTSVGELSSAKVIPEKSASSLLTFGTTTVESANANPSASLFGQTSSPSLKFGQDVISPAASSPSLSFGSQSVVSSSSNNQPLTDTLTFGVNTASGVTPNMSSGISIPTGFSFGAPVSSASTSAPTTSIFTTSSSDQVLPVATFGLSSTAAPASTIGSTSLFGGLNPPSTTSSSVAVTSPSNTGFNVTSASLFGKDTSTPTTSDSTGTSTTSGALGSTSSISTTGGFTFGQTTETTVAPATTVAATVTPSFTFGGSIPAVSSTSIDTQPTQPASSFSFGSSGGGITDLNKSSSVPSTSEVKTGGFSFGQVTTTASSTDVTSGNSAPTFDQASGGFKFGSTPPVSAASNPESTPAVTQANLGLGLPGSISFGQSNPTTTVESTQSIFSTNKDVSSSSTGLFGQPITSAPASLFNTTSSATTSAVPATAISSDANTNAAAPIFSFGQSSSTQVSSGQGLNTSSTFGSSGGSGGFGFNPVFGQKTSDAPASTQPTFGQTTGATTVPAFGQAATSSGTTFGQSTTAGTGLFGQTTTSTTAPTLTFGQGNATANTSFGQSNTVSTGSGFGQDKSTPSFSFGQTGSGTFGQTAPASTVPTFGQGNTSSVTPSFGQSTGSLVPTFGQGNTGTATPTFGQSNTGTSTPTFGQGSTPTTGFGQGNAGSSSGIFGQTGSGTTTSLFGQGNSTGNSGTFGQNNNAPSTGFGKGTAGTGSTMFGQGNTSGSGIVFGQSPTAAAPAFGQTNQGATSPFGQSNTSSTNTFGQSGGSSGVFTFGQPSSTPTFGQANTNATTFGNAANKPVFGQTAANANTSGSSFTSFGQSPSAPSGGFNFGAANNNATLTASPQSSPFGGVSGGGFNAPQPQQGTGMFGSTANANPPAAGVFQFGQPQQQQQQPQGGFNFGQQQQQQQPFGGVAQPQQPMFNMGTSTSSARRRDTRGRRYR